MKEISKSEFESPEYYNESIKYIEAILYVSKQSIGNDLKHHLNGKQTTEEYVAILQDLSQYCWLKTKWTVQSFLRGGYTR